MYKAIDVANKLLYMAENDAGSDLMTNLKLQKMLYYEQGFHLAYFGTPLFEEDIEAWMYGPVVPVVYNAFKSRGRNGIPSDGKPITFSDKKEEDLFAEVFKVYGKYSAIGLMEMTHGEMPWKTTQTGEGSVIDKEKMKSFFKSRLK